ncbi:hypothetical protein ACKWTF_016767 [Chironomus riparius]
MKFAKITAFLILFIKINISKSHVVQASVVPTHQASHVKGDIWVHLWKEFGVNLTTFFVRRKTVINNLSFEISTIRSLEVSGFTIKDSKTISFLPVKVSEVFPNLLIYEANNCAINKLLKPNFENLKKLRVLDLQHNQISSFSEDTFDDLQMLIHLDLANNKLHDIEENSFKNLHVLRNLYLGFNEIKHLHLNVFKPLKELRKVALPSNKIRKIFNNHFSSNKKLTNVWLNENSLQCMDDEVFNDMNRLKFVYLEGNTCIDKDYRDKYLKNIEHDISRNCKQC